MPFDPLDFLSNPSELVFLRSDDAYVPEQLNPCIEDPVVSQTNEVDAGHDSDDSLESTHPHASASSSLHILDLPPLSLSPPFSVLNTILELLAPTQICNFDRDAGDFHTLDSVPDAAEALQWLESHWLPLACESRLQAVAIQAHTLRTVHTLEYNAYMTRIVGKDLGWMLDDETSIIRAAACARLAENCGRTAQPGLERKVVIDGLDSCLYLKEPALTSDNLGLKTWGSSLVLSQKLAAHHHTLLHGSILELGAGTGLVGLVCDKLGYLTTLTDLCEIVENLTHNVTLNKAKSVVCELDWSNPSAYHTLLQDGLSYTTIVASDPVYSAQHPPWLVQVIDAFLSRERGARVLVQVPLRPHYEAERKLLWDCFREKGFVVVQEDTQASHDDFGDMSYTFKMLVRGDETVMKQ